MDIIRIEGLTKRFGNFIANDEITLSVKEGEIHAIVGENGAGKSTLMNMLYGLIKPTSGAIYLRGKEVNIKNPKVAIKLGIGMVHQHFKLVPSLSIFENVLLGDELTKGLIIDKKEEAKKCQETIDKFKFSLNAKDKIMDISIGEEQRVEILKMLYRDVDILILDEPTAVLTPQEADELIHSLLELKKSGKTIIIITHKLGEVKRVSDSVTVIRRGKVIETGIKTAEVSEQDLARLMVGRDVSFELQKNKVNLGCELLKLDAVTTYNDKGFKVLDNVNFSVKEGEVVGVAGVEGNGQSELMKILTGLMLVKSGNIYFKGSNITNFSPKKVRDTGIGIVPEDRYKHGLNRPMSICDNLIAGYHHRKPFSVAGIMMDGAIKSNGEKLIDKYDIRIAEFSGPVSQLSGGNAQKVIVAREMSAEPKLLILSQPTRGVDIGSIEFIHSEIIKFKEQGNGVIVISSELSEVMALSDRILVMYKGKIIGEVDAKDATKEKIGFLMAGIKDKEVAN